MRTGALRRERLGNQGGRCGGCDGLEEASARELGVVHFGRIIAGRPLTTVAQVYPQKRGLRDQGTEGQGAREQGSKKAGTRN